MANIIITTIGLLSMNNNILNITLIDINITHIHIIRIIAEKILP